MKVINTVTFCLFFALICHSQTTPLQKEIVRDFSTSFYYKYKYEKIESVRMSAYLAGNKIGYSLVKIEIAVEKLESDAKFREELYKILIDYSKNNEELLSLNLISLGMTAKNARALSKYILSKYSFSKVDKDDSDSINTKIPFFNGTKKFCDGLNAWYYTVTIKSDSIILKSFPDKANNYYKNKSKPVEVIRGIIKNGQILTKKPPEYKAHRFKFENGILYEVNNEGEYNDYHECK